jgi:hypothetical protein
MSASEEKFNHLVLKIPMRFDDELSLSDLASKCRRLDCFQKLLFNVRKKNQGQFPPDIFWRFQCQKDGDITSVDMCFMHRYTLEDLKKIGVRLATEMGEVDRGESGPFFFGIKNGEDQIVYHSWR